MPDMMLITTLRSLMEWPQMFHREQKQEIPKILTHVHIHRHIYRNMHWRPVVKHKRTSKYIPPTSNSTDGAEEWEEHRDLEHFPRFLELPREIRDLVYEFAMDKMPTRFTIVGNPVFSKDVFWPGTLPSLCFAGKQLQQEGIAAWIRRTRFVMPHWSEPATPLMRFLKAVEGFSEVRMLSFLSMDYYGSDFYEVGTFTIGSPQALAACCPRLRNLLLEIDGWRLLTNDRASVRPDKEIVKLLGLNPLFRLPSLRYIKITLTYPQCFVKMFPPKANIMETISRTLVSVIKNGFEKRGHHGSHLHIAYEQVVHANIFLEL